jgi:hypothetical protein
VSPRAVAGSEVQRILALVPWIVAHPGAPKDEIAQRFGITIDQLESDLDLVLMIGVPPYSPGDYLDVIDDGEHVTLPLKVSRCSPRVGPCSPSPGRIPRDRLRPR